MRRRLFIFGLMLLIFVYTLFISQVNENIMILNTDLYLGLVGYEKLWRTFPTSVLAVASCVVAVGIGAQFWRALLPLCRATWCPTGRLSRWGDLGLWCGWPFFALAYGWAVNVFPYASDATSSALFSRTGLLLQCLAGIGLLVGGRLATYYGGRNIGFAVVPAVAAVALSCGLMWWGEQAVAFLGIAIAMPPALLILFGGENDHKSALSMLLLAGLALAAYAVCSSWLVCGFLPGSRPPLAVPAGAASLGGLVLLLLTPLRSGPVCRFFICPAALLICCFLGCGLFGLAVEIREWQLYTILCCLNTLLLTALCVLFAFSRRWF